MALTLSYKDFELDEAESDTLAEQTDSVLLEFFPNIQNKWAKLGALIVSMIAIYGKKWMGYEKRKKPDIIVRAEENPNKSTGEKTVKENVILPPVKMPKDPPKSLAEELGLENH